MANSEIAKQEISKQEIALLRGLRAVRQFNTNPISQEIVDDLIDVARWSGSAGNSQPWEFVVVRQRKTLQALSKVEGYLGHLAQAQLGIVLVMNGRPGLEMHEAYDEGRLSERLMLAAAAHGVGSCIGWFAGQGPDEAKKLLGIPAERTVRTAISFGYPDEQARQSRPLRKDARKPLSEILHQERYNA